MNVRGHAGILHTPKIGSDLFPQALQFDSTTPNRETEIHLMNLLKKSNRERRIGICGGVGYAHTPTYTPLCSSRVVISVHSLIESAKIL
jgi:hypothetical protein